MTRDEMIAYLQAKLGDSVLTADDREKARRERKVAYDKAYSKANRDKVRANRQAYRAANRDKVNANRQAYRAANGDKVRAYEKTWRAANRDKVRDLNKKHRAHLVANRATQNFFQLTAAAAAMAGINAENKTTTK